MKSGIVYLFGLFLCFTSVHAQTEGPDNLITDRPDQTESPFTLKAGYIQWETGFLYTKNSIFVPSLTGPNAMRADLEGFTYNTSLFRFGLTDKIELRLIQEIGRGRLGDFKSDIEALPTLIGTKIHIAHGEGLKPQIAFLGHIGGPILSDVQSGTQADFRFNFESSLSNNLVLGYNIGGKLENDLKSFTALYTLVFGYNVTPKLYAFAELYGFFPENERADHQVDFGLAYLVSPNFQLDIYTGTGVTRENIATPDTILGFGFSLRIPKK